MSQRPSGSRDGARPLLVFGEDGGGEGKTGGGLMSGGLTARFGGGWPRSAGQMSGERMVRVLRVPPVRWSPESHQLLEYDGCRFLFKASSPGQ